MAKAMRHRRIIAAVFLLCLVGTLFVSLSFAAEPKYLASKIRAPFHYVWCKWARKIAPQNVVYFETREEAIKAGHRPCKICRP